MSHRFLYIITFVDVRFFGDAFIDGDLLFKEIHYTLVDRSYATWGCVADAYDVGNKWICLESSIQYKLFGDFQYYTKVLFETRKNTSYFQFYWVFNRDFMAYYNPKITGSKIPSICIYIYALNNQFFHGSFAILVIHQDMLQWLSSIGQRVLDLAHWNKHT